MKVITELTLLLLTLVFASEADDDRVTKVLSCIKLMKGTLHHDKDYFKEIANTIDATDKNDLAAKFLVKSILNCYNNMGLIKAAEITNTKKIELLNPLKKENKEILDITKYHNKYKDNLALLTRDSERIVGIIRNHLTEVAELEQSVNDALLELYPEDKYESRRRNQQQKVEEEYIYLSFFTKMDPKIKSLFGIGFLTVIALAFYFAVKSLKKNPKTVYMTLC